VLKLEVAPVHIIEMTIQHIGHISSRHILKCPAYYISYGQKMTSKNEFHEKQNSNQFQDNTSNNILRQNPKIQIFLVVMMLECETVKSE